MRSFFSVRKMYIFCLFSLSSSILLANQYSTKHSDYRDTVKYANFDKPFKQGKLKSTALIKEFVKRNYKVFNMKVGFSELAFIKKKQGLTLTSHHYKQNIKGLELINSQLVFSLNKNEDAVLQVYNNYHPVSAPVVRAVPAVSKDQAFDIAWNDLKPTGELIYKPQSKLAYFVNDAGELKLIRRASLSLSEPLGDWMYDVDAQNGQILSSQNLMLDLGKASFQQQKKIGYQTKSRLNAFAEFEKKSLDVKGPRSARVATATAYVFDPDPRTSLKDSSLGDDSDADLFDDAYFKVKLLDLTLKDDVYTLSGPWVNVRDFQGPTSEVSTSESGEWKALRGDTAFNDAMTYYHLDQNQRYIQSLGFKGDTGIQYGSITADSNGAYGADNSFYSSSSNRISFGHGCIDDNEDADVILHEYGHAIQNDINSVWRGGDTGAIGEGFGDYWAGSYSYSKLDEEKFDMYKVFNWDGSDGCWPGRILNAHKLKYDSSETYSAHRRLENGRSADELWSTPLFSSLVELVKKGIPREQVDKIVLESHFGLGSKIKMPDMAMATISAAKRLYPEGPHAGVFEENFKKHNMLED